MTNSPKEVRHVRTLDARETISVCIETLRYHGERIARLIEAGDQPGEPPAVFITRAFVFGRRCLEAIKLLLPQREFAPILPAICRPFYELAVRVLWASREPDGWQRLQSHFANEHKKWAQEASQFEREKEHAQAILKEVREVLGRKDKNGKQFRAAPNMREMLKEIEDKDVAEGLRDKPGDQGAYEYANIYRVICGPAHAHPVAIGSTKPDAHLRHTVITAVVSTLALIRTTCHVTEAATKEALEQATSEAQKLIKGCATLSYDQIESATRKAGNKDA